MADYIDIKTSKQRNPAGTKRGFYFAPTRTFDVLADVPANPLELKDQNVIVDDHEFTTPYGFYFVELETDMNELNSEYIGQVKGGDNAFNFTGFAAGMSDEQIAAFENVTQEEHIVLIPLKDGKIMQLGEKDMGVSIRTSFQAGKESDGNRGYNIAITHYGRVVRYAGLITKAGA
jgi:hypothetical protein